MACYLILVAIDWVLIAFNLVLISINCIVAPQYSVLISKGSVTVPFYWVSITDQIVTMSLNSIFVTSSSVTMTFNCIKVTNYNVPAAIHIIFAPFYPAIFAHSDIVLISQNGIVHTKGKVLVTHYRAITTNKVVVVSIESVVLSTQPISRPLYLVTSFFFSFWLRWEEVIEGKDRVVWSLSVMEWFPSVLHLWK